MRIDFRRAFLLSALLWWLGAAAFASPLRGVAPGLSDKEIASLQAGQTLLESPADAASMRFPPKGVAGSELRALPEQFKVPVYVESAFLVSNGLFDKAEKLRIVNALLAVESLSGVKYYSERKQGIAVLYDDVYRVKAPGSVKRLPPLALTELPESLETFIHLRDSNFGSSWYALELKQAQDALLFSMQNKKPLSFMLLQAFAVDGVRMRVAIVPVDEGIYIAAICAANPAKLAASLVDMYSAMEKRLRAVQGWVVERIKKGSPL